MDRFSQNKELLLSLPQLTLETKAVSLSALVKKKGTCPPSDIALYHALSILHTQGLTPYLPPPNSYATISGAVSRCGSYANHLRELEQQKKEALALKLQEEEEEKKAALRMEKEKKKIRAKMGIWDAPLSVGSNSHIVLNYLQDYAFKPNQRRHQTSTTI